MYVQAKMVNKRRQSDPCPNNSDSSSDEDFRNNKAKGESTPKCTHIKKAVEIQKLRKIFKKSSVENEKCVDCSKLSNGDADGEDFEQDRSLWMCLKCGTHLCGRLVNQHALKHYQVSATTKRESGNCDFINNFETIFFIDIKKLNQL